MKEKKTVLMTPYTQPVLLLKKAWSQVVVALVRAQAVLDNFKGDNDDQTAGITNILRRAMEAPLRQIVTNAGDVKPVIINQVKSGTGNYGYNAATGEYGDMLEMGYS